MNLLVFKLGMCVVAFLPSVQLYLQGDQNVNSISKFQNEAKTFVPEAKPSTGKTLRHPTSIGTQPLSDYFNQYEKSLKYTTRKSEQALETLKNCIFKETSKKLETTLNELIKNSNEEIFNFVKAKKENPSLPVAPTKGINPVLAQNNHDNLNRKARQDLSRQQAVDNFSNCALKSELQEHTLVETVHIASIKQELEKLQQLVRLLQDQQYILNILSDLDSKPKSPDLIDQKQLIKLFNLLKNNIPSAKSLNNDSGTKPVSSSPINPQISFENDIPNFRAHKEIPAQNRENITALSQEIKQLKHLIVDKTLQDVRNKKEEEKLQRELENQKKALQDLQRRIEGLKNPQTAPSKMEAQGNPKTRQSENGNQMELLQHELQDLEGKLSAMMSRNAQNPSFAREDILGAALPRHFHSHNSSLIGKLRPKARKSNLFSRQSVSEDDNATFENLLHMFNGDEIKPKTTVPQNPELELEELQKELDSLVQTSNTKSGLPVPSPTIKTKEEQLVENLQKLLEKSEPPEESENKNAAPDLQNRLAHLQKRMEIIKKIHKLEKKVNNLHETDDGEFKTTDDDEDDDDNVKTQLKKMMREIKKLNKNKVEAKGLDDIDDIQHEFKNLQTEINKLKPKSDEDSSGKIEVNKAAELQVILNKLLQAGDATHVAPTAVEGHHLHLTPAQIQILKNKIIEIRKGKPLLVGPNPHGYFGPNGAPYGYPKTGGHGPYGGGGLVFGNSGYGNPGGTRLYGTGQYTPGIVPYPAGSGYGFGYGPAGATSQGVSEGQFGNYENKELAAFAGTGASSQSSGGVYGPAGGLYGPGGSLYGPGNKLYGPGAAPTGGGLYGAGNKLYGPGAAPTGGLYEAGEVPYGPGSVSYGPGGVSYGPGGISYAPGAAPYAAGGSSSYGPSSGSYVTENHLHGSEGALFGSQGASYGPRNDLYGPGSGSFESGAPYGSGSKLYNHRGALFGHGMNLFRPADVPFKFGYGPGSALYEAQNAPYGSTNGPYTSGAKPPLLDLHKPASGLYGSRGNPYGFGNDHKNYGHGAKPHGLNAGPYGPYTKNYGPGTESDRKYGPGGVKYEALHGNGAGQYGKYGNQQGSNAAAYSTPTQYGNNEEYGSNQKPINQYEEPSANSAPIYPSPPLLPPYSKPNIFSQANPPYPTNPQNFYNQVNQPTNYPPSNTYQNENNKYKPQPPSNPDYNGHGVFEHPANNYAHEPATQFFPGQPEQGYESANGEDHAPAAYGNAPSAAQSYSNAPQAPDDGAAYSHQKVRELKTQIYGLENVISNLNRPEYVQKPEDQEMKQELDQKINNLKSMVNFLSQDVPPNPNAYALDAGNFEPNPDYQQPPPTSEDQMYDSSNAYPPGDVPNEVPHDQQYPPISRRKRQTTVENEEQQSKSESTDAVSEFFQKVQDIFDVIKYYSQDLSKKAKEKARQEDPSFMDDQDFDLDRENISSEKEDRYPKRLTLKREYRETTKDEEPDPEETDDALLVLFNQLNNVAKVVNHLAKGISKNICNCSSSKDWSNITAADLGSINEILKYQPLSPVTRRKRQVEADDSTEKVWNKMSTFLRSMIDDDSSQETTDDGEEEESKARQSEDPNPSNFLPKQDLQTTQEKLQQKLQDLKKQLELKMHSRFYHQSPLHNQQSVLQNQNSANKPFTTSNLRSAYYGPPPYYQQQSYYPKPSYYQPNYYQKPYYEEEDKKFKLKKLKFDKKSKKLEKKNDILDKIFAKILNKILDKVITSIPIITKKLLSFDLKELFYDYGYEKGGYGYEKGGDGYEQGGYGYGNDYGQDYYGVQKGYTKLGIFGYIPFIIMKLLTSLSSFVKHLQKNKFIKTFLVPALITAGTAGLVIFLVWWLTGDDLYGNGFYGQNGYDSASYGYSNGYGGGYSNGYGGGYSSGYGGGYSSSYGGGYKSNDDYGDNYRSSTNLDKENSIFNRNFDNSFYSRANYRKNLDLPNNVRGENYYGYPRKGDFARDVNIDSNSGNHRFKLGSANSNYYNRNNFNDRYRRNQ